MTLDKREITKELIEGIVVACLQRFKTDKKVYELDNILKLLQIRSVFVEDTLKI